MSNGHMKPADLIAGIRKQKEHFDLANAGNGGLLDFEQECLFARSQILKSDRTLEAAQRNPNSLFSAVLNGAAIGITLNPAKAHAYLVPRDGAICLDISYKGLVWLATSTGAIKHCKSVLVYAADEFTWRGPYESPEHKANPFMSMEERGDVIGAYNIAHLSDGMVMCDTMSREDLTRVQMTSKARNGPWKTWPDQMMLKAMTKRASKSWPQTGAMERFSKAVDVLNEHEGLLVTESDRVRYLEALEGGDSIAFVKTISEFTAEQQAELFNSFDKGEKTKRKQSHRELEAKGWEAVEQYKEQISDAMDREDGLGVQELEEELGEHFDFVMQRVGKALPEHAA